MIIPKKYEKYNILPVSVEEDIEVFEVGKWVLEADYQITTAYKIPVSICPDSSLKSLDVYFEFLDELQRKCRKVKDIDFLVSMMKKEMLYLNDKEKWTVLKYIGKTDEFENGKYYFCTHYDASVKWANILHDGEYSSEMCPYEPGDWEVVEDPRGWFGKNPPALDDKNFKYE